MSGEPDRYLFVHIPKTGGTTLRARLINHFGETAVYPTRGLDGTDQFRLVLSIDHLRERLAARGDQIRLVTGHFPLSVTELIPGRYTTFTLLRDPVERMLSHLRHHRERHPAARGISLEEIYRHRDRFPGLAADHMTKMLALSSSEIEAFRAAIDAQPAQLASAPGARPGLAPEHLERAKRALAGMDAVGLQEQLDAFCEDLAVRFGWDLGEPETLNASTPADASERLRTMIAADNPFDVELYEFARRLLGQCRDLDSPLQMTGVKR